MDGDAFFLPSFHWDLFKPASLTEEDQEQQSKGSDEHWLLLRERNFSFEELP